MKLYCLASPWARGFLAQILLPKSSSQSVYFWTLFWISFLASEGAKRILASEGAKRSAIRPRVLGRAIPSGHNA